MMHQMLLEIKLLWHRWWIPRIQLNIGGVFLLRQSALTDLARRVCRSFIRPSVSFLVF